MNPLLRLVASHPLLRDLVFGNGLGRERESARVAPRTPELRELLRETAFSLREFLS